ncbi:MAG: hypothetical protein IPJ81_02495 [Chitinophagaceae bacterium]|nr:hypothetical protein [Chitinophagaceae bacterium]
MYTGNINEDKNFSETVATSQEIGNKINNPQGLQSIKNKIANIDSSLVVIKVLHIGDSHLKSGYFSQPFMEKLNTYYLQKFNGSVFFNFQTFCKVGTKYSDYNELAELDNQLLSEKYDLVVVSLGTNDAFSGSARTGFYGKVDHLVNKIKTLSPQAAIMLTTPPDGLKKNKSGQYLALPDLENVVNTIVKYADDHAIACWNLHRIMGAVIQSIAGTSESLLRLTGYILPPKDTTYLPTGCLKHFVLLWKINHLTLLIYNL